MIITNFPRDWNASALNGFVKKLACCHADRTYVMETIPSANSSVDMWWHTSMCFEFESLKGFCVSCTAPSLSLHTGTYCPHSRQHKHQTCCRSTTPLIVSAIATYSGSVVETSLLRYIKPPHTSTPTQYHFPCNRCPIGFRDRVVCIGKHLHQHPNPKNSS